MPRLYGNELSRSVIIFYSSDIMLQMKAEIDVRYLIQNTATLMGIPVSYFPEGGEEEMIHQEGFPLSATRLAEDQVRKRKEHVGYLYDIHGNLYGFLKEESFQAIFGPVPPMERSEQDIADFAFDLGILKEQYSSFHDSYRNCTPLPLNTLILSLFSIHHAVTGEKLSLASVFTSSPASELGKERKGTKDVLPAFSHASSYKGERELLSLVETGNIAGFLSWVSAIPSIQAGETSYNHVEQAHNLFVISVTLISRAAIKGGLDPESALSLSDSYLQKSETLTSQDELLSLQLEMVKDYIERVHLLGEKKNDLAFKVANYVQAHSSSPIKLKEVSQALVMSESSLCARFKKENGISVGAFIEERKIDTACRYLLDSDQSGEEIAFYLGYSSSSHFTRSFKKIKGVTPSQYRKAHRRS